MENETEDVMDSLVRVLQERKKRPSENSYTASLFRQGNKKICEKISEEANELVEAALETTVDNHHVIHESADLVFHTLVLLVNMGLSLEDVRAELHKRFGTSGLEEKANRLP